VGTRQSLYVVYTTLQRPVFLVNSRQSRFSETPTGFGGKLLHRQRHPLSRSYGVNMLSSLTRVLSSALGYSPRLPVSVCGTDTIPVLRNEAFLGAVSGYFGNKSASSSPLGLCGRIYLPTTLGLEPRIDRRPTFYCTSPHRTGRWYGNINPLSIVYAFRPRLRVRLTLGGMAFPRKP
jgi:hypothetical protein